MDSLRKSGPLNFSSKFMIACPNPILVHFPIVQISGFGPIKTRSKNLDQNWKLELLKSGPKSDLDTSIINFEEELSGPDFQSESIT